MAAGRESTSSDSQRNLDPNCDASRVIVDVLGKLERWSKGRDIDSVVKRCEKDNGWDRNETMKAIEAAMQQGLIEEATFNGNVTLRECQQDTPKVTFGDKKGVYRPKPHLTTVFTMILSILRKPFGMKLPNSNVKLALSAILVDATPTCLQKRLQKLYMRK